MTKRKPENGEPKIITTVETYTSEYGEYVVKDVLSEIHKHEPTIAELVEHLFHRVREHDERARLPKGERFTALMQYVADVMGDVGALVAGIVSEDEVFGYVGGDMRHRNNLINLLAREQRKQYLKEELAKLEEPSPGSSN